MFPFLAYSNVETVNHKRMPLASIYTMNVNDEASYRMGYHELFDKYESTLERIFTKPEHLYVHETYQFKDYSLYQHNFDEEAKRKQMEEQFPKDLEEAYNIGVQLVKDVIDAKN